MTARKFAIKLEFTPKHLKLFGIFLVIVFLVLLGPYIVPNTSLLLFFPVAFFLFLPNLYSVAAAVMFIEFVGIRHYTWHEFGPVPMGFADWFYILLFYVVLAFVFSFLRLKARKQ